MSSVGNILEQMSSRQLTHPFISHIQSTEFLTGSIIFTVPLLQGIVISFCGLHTVVSDLLKV